MKKRSSQPKISQKDRFHMHIQNLKAKLQKDYLSFLGTEDWKEQLGELLERNKGELKKILEEMYDSDIAYLMEQVSVEKGRKILELVEGSRRGNILLECDKHIRDRLIEGLGEEDIKRIISDIESDLRADILEGLGEEKKGKVLSMLKPEMRVEATELLRYESGTAGSIMSTDYVSVGEGSTVNKAIKAVRELSRRGVEIYQVFVVDREGRYKGHITLQDLVLTRGHIKVEKVMRKELLEIPVGMDVEEVARIFSRYDFVSAPVVDEAGRLIGRITVDDVVDVIQEESTEDILKMGGLPGEETIHTPFIKAALRRTYWMMLDLPTEFLVGAVVKIFEPTLEKLVVLATFLPIVAGQGGNAGIQSISFIIRSLTLGDVQHKGEKIFIYRSFLMAITIGLLIATIASVVIFLFSKNIWLTLIMFLSMLFNNFSGILAGTLIPLILKKFKIDPAVASGIILTTITDVSGYFYVFIFAHIFMDKIIDVISLF